LPHGSKYYHYAHFLFLCFIIGGMEKEFVKDRYASIRNAHQISARKLSFALGQSSEYINQIENGKMMPSVEGLLNFCDFFGIKPSEFFDETMNYPIEFKGIIRELNKLDSIELKQVSDLLRLITSGKERPKSKKHETA